VSRRRRPIKLPLPVLDALEAFIATMG